MICFSVSLLPLFGIDAETDARLRKLAEQNEQLQRVIAEQGKTIDSLTNKISQLEVSRGEVATSDSSARSFLGPIGQTRINIGGQIAAGYFKTGREGIFPNGEFRVDDLRVSLDARAWEDVYAYVEMEWMTREGGDENNHIAEAYIDLERVVKWHGLDSLVNLRMGRFYTPFGEEYAQRHPMEDPLITHSLADLWAYDEGAEVYGSHGKVSYAVAIQNGGVSGLRDFTSDKAYAGRLSYDPVKWLHLSASGMRSGDTSAKDDFLTAMWFGNGFFRSIGSSATTRFHADMWEGDVQFLFPKGHVKLAGGAVYYNDNDPLGDNSRTIYHYSAEGMYRLCKQFYAATRFSQVIVNDGYPVMGHGTWNDYFMTELTDNIWRASIGVGYTPNPNFVVKLEYAIERGTTVSGEHRDHEDFFGVQAAARF